MKVRVRGLRARVKKGGGNAVSKSCQGSCFTMIKKKIPTVVCIDRCTTLEHILYECQQTMEGIFRICLTCYAIGQFLIAVNDQISTQSSA